MMMFLKNGILYIGFCSTVMAYQSGFHTKFGASSIGSQTERDQGRPFTGSQTRGDLHLAGNRDKSASNGKSRNRTRNDARTTAPYSRQCGSSARPPAASNWGNPLCGICSYGSNRIFHKHHSSKDLRRRAGVELSNPLD